jgi:hypothetical protein
MFNENNVLDYASNELSNFVYLYGGEGYFTNIEKTCFEVEIYNVKCREVNRLSKEEALTHLLKKVSIDFSDCIDELESLMGFKIASKVIAKLKEE